MTLDEWILTENTGISSKTIWAVLKGINHEGDRPYDICDFKRCYDLINECDVRMNEFKKISSKLPYWKPYVDNWEVLINLYFHGDINEMRLLLMQIGLESDQIRYNKK